VIIFFDYIHDMRTSENKMCDNQPHTEAAGKERLFSVYVCMCECHDQKTK